MPRYAVDARKKFDQDRTSAAAEIMIREVYYRAEAGARKAQLAIRCIRALFKLTNSTCKKYCLSKDIREEAGIDKYQSLQWGFYVWNDTGCKIVGQDMTLKQYWIIDEFLNPLKKVLETMNDTN